MEERKFNYAWFVRFGEMRGFKGLCKILYEQFMIFMGYVSIKDINTSATANTSIIFHQNL